MLLRVRQDHRAVTTGPVGLPRPPGLVGSTNNYTTMPFMRPNQNTDNTVPAPGPLCASPDIWIAGQTAIGNYQTALATDASYATESGNNIMSGEINLIYIRAKNGSASTQSATVQLYYAPSGIIQSPSEWQNNVIPTDQQASSGNITGLTAGTVGVCDATFTWTNPPNPPTGSDHFCLFAQLNDANNDNPFPLASTVTDMNTLIQSNLAWGWRNVSLIPGSNQSWGYQEPLTIPLSIPTTNTYTVGVTPSSPWIGWAVEFYATEADSNGNPIVLSRQQITQANQFIGLTNVTLEPGWSAGVRVNTYGPNGSTAPPEGATLPLSCNYVATGSALREAIELGLIDWEWQHRLRRHIDIGPTAWLAVGTYTGKASESEGAKRWLKALGARVLEED